MSQANAILGLIAQTSIHAGSGSSVSAVDLPIQREGHNGWPCVFGSAVKGALRTKAEGTLDQDTQFVVFGPDTTKASEHAGSICVGDARLLLLPIRSLTSTFKWVTCGEALKRLKRDAELLDLNELTVQFGVSDVMDAANVCNASVPQTVSSGDLFLEEYCFRASPVDLSQVIAGLAALMQRADAKTELQKRLVIVSDDMFSFLAQHSTPVTAHIAIHTDTKTVRSGALWYEETLPPETLLYVPLMAEKSRKKEKGMTAEQILKAVAEDLFKADGKDHLWLQVGGNETLGMGWCGVKIIKSGG
jgi:CRISPR-associated protein Cmr4